MTDTAAAARRIVEDNRYAVLATVDADGPWVTPVWFAHVDLRTVLWVSSPESRHSRALAADPRVAVTVFDSTVEPGHGTAFYGRGRAVECPEERIDELVAAYTARSAAQGLAPWSRSDVTGRATFRLYVAELGELSLLPGGGPDRRVPVGHA